MKLALCEIIRRRAECGELESACFSKWKATSQLQTSTVIGEHMPTLALFSDFEEVRNPDFHGKGPYV